MKHNFKDFIIALFIISLVILYTQFSVANNAPNKTSWELNNERLEKLDKINFHPRLLPIILENKDVLGLTEQQIRRFTKWRKTDAPKMVALMNQIIQKRLTFQQMVTDPSVSEIDLMAEQEVIFELQRQLLSYKMTCRHNMMTTFTQTQWDEFYFIISEMGFVTKDHVDLDEKINV